MTVMKKKLWFHLEQAKPIGPKYFSLRGPDYKIMKFFYNEVENIKI